MNFDHIHVNSDSAQEFSYPAWLKLSGSIFKPLQLIHILNIVARFSLNSLLIVCRLQVLYVIISQVTCIFLKHWITITKSASFILVLKSQQRFLNTTITCHCCLYILCPYLSWWLMHSSHIICKDNIALIYINYVIH